MGDRDEFDGESDAPVPPYEREWRHPAEVSDAARQRRAAESAPPPIGRRATMLVALVSLAASAALLVVTVPKGVDHRQESSDAVDPATTTTAVTKGFIAPHTPALRLTDTYFLLAPGAPAGLRRVSVEGETVDVTAVESFAVSGYSLARAAHAVADQGLDYPDLSREELDYLLGGDSLHVVDINGRTHAARWSATTEVSAQSSGTYPIDVDPAFSGPGVLMTSDDSVIGVVERREHRNVMELLSKVLQRVSANAGG